MISHHFYHSVFFIYTTMSITSYVLAMENNQHIVPINPAQYTFEEAFDKAIIVRKIQPEERLGTCFTYALSCHLGIVGKAPQQFKVNTNFIACFDVLTHYYQQTIHPQPENLVVYRLNPHMQPAHFAILKKVGATPADHIVESIWGLLECIVQNKLYEVAAEYGTNISYYELKPEFAQNKNLFLKDIQKKIAENGGIKYENNQAQVMLLNLANGKNITNQYNPTFNALSTMQKKAAFLLKFYMGLSIDTFRAQTKETVLMLATKRNDTEMMKIFLSMGAATQRKDSNGNTALMIAEKAGYYNAVKLLNEYNATE